MYKMLPLKTSNVGIERQHCAIRILPTMTTHTLWTGEGRLCSNRTRHGSKKGLCLFSDVVVSDCKPIKRPKVRPSLTSLIVQI